MVELESSKKFVELTWNDPVERFSCKMHLLNELVLLRYFVVSCHCDILRPLWCWNRNVGTHDTYWGVEGIAQH